MRWFSLTHRGGLVLIEANLKTGSQRNKKANISLRHHLLPPLPPPPPPPPDLTSKERAQKFHTDDVSLPRSEWCFCLVENLLHPSFCFIWDFEILCGLPLYTLNLRLQRVLVWWPHLSRLAQQGLHQQQVQCPPHIDVRYERAGPPLKSKELFGLGDDGMDLRVPRKRATDGDSVIFSLREGFRHTIILSVFRTVPRAYLNF